MKPLFRVLLSSVVAGLFLFSGLNAYALSSGGIGALPANPDPNVRFSDSWFIYNLDAGESKEDAVSVFNRSDETEAVKIYAVDAIPSNQGNFALEKEEAPRVGIGAWIELADTLITLEPGQQANVPFTITIPENADVGEHAGGIVVQKAQITDTGEVSSSSIVTRIGVRVYETVPGEIKRNIELESFSVSERTNAKGDPVYYIELSVNNDSNVSLSPTVQLSVTGWGMTEYFARSKAEGGFFFSDFTNFFSGEELAPFEWQLFKGKKVSTNWEWPKPEFGTYNFQATITYDDDGEEKVVQTDVVTITLIPWNLIAIAGGIIGFFLLLIILRLFRKSTRRWKVYTVKRGDQLPTIAALSGVRWKKLMKANRLTSPKLKPGQKIRVPKKFIKLSAMTDIEDDDDEADVEILRREPPKQKRAARVQKISVRDEEVEAPKKSTRKKSTTGTTKTKPKTKKRKRKVT